MLTWLRLANQGLFFTACLESLGKVFSEVTVEQAPDFSVMNEHSEMSVCTSWARHRGWKTRLTCINLSRQASHSKGMAIDDRIMIYNIYLSIAEINIHCCHEHQLLIGCLAWVNYKIDYLTELSGCRLLAASDTVTADVLLLPCWLLISRVLPKMT